MDLLPNNRMDHITSLNDLLAELAWRYDIQGLRLSQEGTAGLELKDGARLHFEYVPATHRLFICSILMTLPAEEAERLALLNLALEMNCLEQGTLCGILAIDAAEDVLMYQIGVDVMELKLEHLDHMLQKTLVHTQRLLRELDEFLVQRRVPHTPGFLRKGEPLELK